jgi:hypothetical protein
VSGGDVTMSAPVSRARAASGWRWLLLAALSVLAGGAARADTPAVAVAPEPPPRWRWSALGYARAIPTAWSASRDTPRLEMTPFPRPVAAAGGELALVTLAEGSRVWRLDVSGLLELDNLSRTTGVNSGPFAGSLGRILWRGGYSYTLAVQLDALGRLICSRCSAELALGYRHESDHATASNYAGDSTDFSTEPYVGDDVIADAALAQRWRDWYLSQRLVGMWFLPDRSSYSAGAAVDLHARLTRWRAVHPFLSAYAERRQGTTFQALAFHDAYRAGAARRRLPVQPRRHHGVRFGRRRKSLRRPGEHRRGHGRRRGAAVDRAVLGGA